MLVGAGQALAQLAARAHELGGPAQRVIVDGSEPLVLGRSARCSVSRSAGLRRCDALNAQVEGLVGKPLEVRRRVADGIRAEMRQARRHELHVGKQLGRELLCRHALAFAQDAVHHQAAH